MPRFLAPITVAQEYVTGNETISGIQTVIGATSGRDSYWTEVSIQSGLSADYGSFVHNVSALAFYGDGSKLTGITTGNYLSSTGGTLTGGLTGTTGVFTTSISSFSISGTHYGDGNNLTNLNLTNLNANNITSGTLSAARLPAFTGDITTLAGSSSATVVKVQGYPISTQTPSIGQMLQWSGTAWVPGTIPTGGSGGGGVVYYLNYGTAGDTPIAGLSGTSYELGRVSTSVLSSATFTNVSEINWDTLATFVTDNLDPEVIVIAAGIWDLNFWASSTASIQTQMMVRYQLYTYNDTLSTTTLIATSDTYNVYDPAVVAQYVLSMIVPQTTIDINDRLFVVLQAKAASPNKDITVYFNNGRPTHIHTTIPSVGGSGLVKVVNGVYQSPASLLVDVDVAANAQINQSKILNLTSDLSSKFDKAGGTLTGGITGTTASFSGAVYGSTATAGTSSTQLATTAFVQDNLTTGLASGSAIAATVVATVTNADTVTLTRGMVVYAFGSQGDRVSVKRASASGDPTSAQTIGLINETIPVGQIGTITLYGSMDKLDLGTPFVAGDTLYLGTSAGTFTNVKPQAPTHLVYLGVVERANAGNGTAYIKVQNGYELNELHDVLIVNPSARYIIQRSNDNSLWVSTSALFFDSEIYSSNKWNSTTTTVSSNSAKWESVYSTTNNLSSNWNSTVNTVSSLSSNWQSVYSGVSSTSGNWNNTYSTVCANSAQWSITTDITKLPLSGGNLTGSLTVNGTISSSGAITASIFYGDGSNLTGISQGGAVDTTKLPLSGGTITGNLTVTGTFSTVNTNNWQNTYTTVSSNSAKWESVYSTVNSNSASYATLTGTQKLTNKTIVDWMTLVRGYNTTPTLLTSLVNGDVYSYIYNSSPSNITYYRFIATDGSEDKFYSYFSGNTLSGLIASKSIFI
jgi:hypothetical protein